MKRKEFVRLATQLQKAETPEALFYLLKTTRYQFETLCINPPYQFFKLPKRNGEWRTIEDPAHELQTIQARLKKHLQALYHCYRTEAAYGYISQASDDNEIRGIYGNALKHGANTWLLNLDLKDFFHFIRWQALFASLSGGPFGLHPAVAKSIADISTLEGRLPMGAPTSPVLSNIASYTLDQDLLTYCRQEELTYTRYVDDLCFSAKAPISDRQLQQINSFILRHGHTINPQKLRRFRPGETKVVTGLEIQDGAVRVPESFVAEVTGEIDNLKAWVLMQTRLHPAGSLEKQLVKPMQKISGALNFISTVHGAEHPPLRQLEQKLEEAVQPPADYESMNWLQLGYETF